MKRSLAKVVLVVGVALGFIRLAAACIDLTPIDVPPREAAVLEGASCLSCLEKPNAELGCADQLRVCRSEGRCRTISDCMIENGCLEYVRIDDKLACSIGCLEDSGIFTIRDPNVELLLGILKCGEVNCPRECGFDGVDGGASFDL